MRPVASNRVVHLELHTGDLARARAFYAEICGWRTQRIVTRTGSYHALELAETLGGGIVECPIERPLVPPENRPSVIRAHLAPRPRPLRKLVG